MARERQKIIVIAGPTAVGKSAVAIRLAKKFTGEIISADSRQVYTGLDIGTGKVTTKEMWDVPHHLLNVANPKRQFSVSDFIQLAAKAIEDIHARGKLPIVTGGAGLYIDSLFGRFHIPDVPPSPTLRKRLDEKSAEALYVLLQKLDPKRAATIDRHNPRRLIRAIEIVSALGRVPATCLKSHHMMGFETSANWQRNDGMNEVLWIGLTVPADDLRRRIKKRLETRLREGMPSEARHLHAKGLSWKRMESLGLEYRYLSRYLRGMLTKEEMAERLNIEIWHYAKRQMTWFKRNAEIRWFAPREARSIERRVRLFLSR